MDTESLLHHIIDITEEFKAVDPKVLKVTDVCSFADYFVIVSGTSSRHIQSMSEEIILKCKHAGHPALSVEGVSSGEWCLLDFGAIIVHIFDPKKREFYNLEELWQEGEELRFGKDADPS